MIATTNCWTSNVFLLQVLHLPPKIIKKKHKLKEKRIYVIAETEAETTLLDYFYTGKTRRRDNRRDEETCRNYTNEITSRKHTTAITSMLTFEGFIARPPSHFASKSFTNKRDD